MIYAYDVMAKENRFDDAIVEFVRSRDWVSFVELTDWLDMYLPTAGNGRLLFAQNIVVWADVSEEFANLIVRLRESRRIIFHPGSWLAYFIDGGTLRLPLAKRIPKQGYRREHWFPVSLRVVPLEER